MTSADLSPASVSRPARTRSSVAQVCPKSVQGEAADLGQFTDPHELLAVERASTQASPQDSGEDSQSPFALRIVLRCVAPV